MTLYNLKGEAIFDLGEGPRNDVFYNRFGNILLVCGFGNIAAGKMEFWNMDERKEIVRVCHPSNHFFQKVLDALGDFLRSYLFHFLCP